jgi:tRNA wybutosine-synthesizing protein 3
MRMDGWKRYREKHLGKYENARRAGAADAPIVPLLDAINEHEEYVTTSSCSGRVTLLATDRSEKKGVSYFYRKWHRPVLFDELWNAIRNYHGEGILLLKFDPFILHVGAKDLEAAAKLVKIAHEAGVKIAGIQSLDETKAHVEIRGIDTVSLPVWDKKPLITEEYARYITNYLNRKFVRNAERLARLYEAVITRL